VLDDATYRLLAQRLRDGRCSTAALFDEAKRLPDEQIRRFRREIEQADEIDVRIFFYRVLYRFYLKRPDVRDEYVGLIRSARTAWRRTPRTALIFCADLIDVGEYDAAFTALRSRVWRYNRRWRISALFQLLRIGHCSEAHRARCLRYVRWLRRMLEADLARGRNEDRVTKYALCSLFITHGYVRAFKDDTDSDLVREAAARLERGMAELLIDERSWDAC
jgi:hypothetical protein